MRGIYFFYFFYYLDPVQIMQFSQVYGQNQLKEKLINSVQEGRIAHAQLFFGPGGSGSLALALAYIQYVACLARSEMDSCGTCSSCRKISRLEHPDLHFVFPVNITKKISKDPMCDDFLPEWREFVLANPYFTDNQWYDFIGLANKQGLISKRESDAIIRKLSLKSFESDYKFMLVWLPEKMNASSANVLLKLIEEPPPKTLFLFVSENPGQLLITIASRLQHVRLAAIDDESMRLALQQRYQISGEASDDIVHLARGNLVEAAEMVRTSEENELNLERFISIMRFCWTRSYLEVNNWVEEMAGLGRENLKNFFNYALHLVRENFILNLKNDKLNYMTQKEAEFASRFHPFINGNNVIRISEELTSAMADIQRNGYAKLVLFDMSLRLMKLIRSK